jgi:hypothetical protein
MKQNLTISQALKEKNKIASTIQKNWSKIMDYNSLPKGANRPYDIIVLKNETLELTNELIALKSMVHEASSPVRSKIFRLSELKSMMQQLLSISTKDGLVKSRGLELIEMEAILKVKDIDELLLNYQAEIDQIQNELDNFNFSTILG